MLNLFGSKIDVVEKLDDLKDPRAFRLAKDNFMRVKDLPILHQQLGALEENGRIKIEIDIAYFRGLTQPPPLYRQLIAGAILHYELVRKGRFRIPIAESNHGILETILYTVFNRFVKPQEHEAVAESYEQAAESIYSAYLENA